MTRLRIGSSIGPKCGRVGWDHPAGPDQFGTVRLAAGVQVAATDVDGSGVDLPDHGELGRGEAGVVVGAGRAGQGGRVERAAPRVVELAVDEAVETVAAGHHRGVQRGQFARRQDDPARGVEIDPGQPRLVESVEFGRDGRRGAGEDAVEVVRVALRLGQCLVAAL